MTEEAHERLATIAQHQALGSGFQIAMRDLEIRGAGNMLGAEQSGHIAAVGFDAYARILQESVRELQGKPIERQKELRIDLPVKAFVPPGWVAQEALRLELYRRISLAGDHAVLGEIRDETIDRYGALPEQVEVLFAIASLRLTAARLGVEEVTTYRDQVRLTPVAIPDALARRSSGADPGGDVPRRRSERSTSSPSGSSVPIWCGGSRRDCVRRSASRPNWASRFPNPLRRPPRKLQGCIPLGVSFRSSWGRRSSSSRPRADGPRGSPRPPTLPGPR